MARVTHLFRAPKRREPMEELVEALAVEDVGSKDVPTRGQRESGRFY